MTKLLLLSESFAVEKAVAKVEALPSSLPEKFHEFAATHGAMPTTYPITIDYK